MSYFASLGSDGTGDIPFLRLTVVGAKGCGKTCLINSWVNNFCPTVYQPTDYPQLYYRTMRMQSSDTDQIVTALVEIEDTCEHESPTETLATLTHYWGGSKTRRTINENFLHQVEVSGRSTKDISGSPFKDVEPPMQGDSKNSHMPRARGRMGFVVVFDCCSQISLATALGVCRDLIIQKTESPVYLVASKIDKDPMAPLCKENVAKAEDFVRAHDRQPPMRFMEVSAQEYTRVRKLFRDIVEEIFQNPELWMSADAARSWRSHYGRRKEESSMLGGWLGGLFG